MNTWPKIIGVLLELAGYPRTLAHHRKGNTRSGPWEEKIVRPLMETDEFQDYMTGEIEHREACNIARVAIRSHGYCRLEHMTADKTRVGEYINIKTMSLLELQTFAQYRDGLTKVDIKANIEALKIIASERPEFKPACEAYIQQYMKRLVA